MTGPPRSPSSVSRQSCAKRWRAISPAWSSGGSPRCDHWAHAGRCPALTVDVLLVANTDVALIGELLGRFGISTCLVSEGAIPGSYWGDSEAGLVGNKLYMRADTPVHSVLHEASHFVCMDERRRAQLDKDAGGDFEEENAVCYLQSLLADAL